MIKIELDDIQLLENYRGYDRIWCYTPIYTAPHIHMGYLCKDFFFYILPPYHRFIDINTPTSIVDYYLDMIFLKDPGSEYNLAFMNDEYRPYLNALNSMKSMTEVDKGFGCE